ncbi:MAG: GNA1162 family protein [Candidatus Egerieousia sp.]
MKNFILILVASLIVVSCGTSKRLTRSSQYAKMYEEKPLTLLVMPPINNTPNVEAKDLLYTSISRPLLESGYYVVSPLLAMDILKAESAYDSENFVNAPLETFKKFFGADAVVFSEINAWEKKGTGIQTNIRYYIKSATSGEILFDRSCELYLSLSVNSGGSDLFSAIVDLAATAINTVATKHIVAARRANYFIFRDIPRGKYSPEYMKDGDYIAEKKDVKASVK